MSKNNSYEDKDPQDWNDKDIAQFLEDEEEMKEELTEILESSQAAESN